MTELMAGFFVVIDLVLAYAIFKFIKSLQADDSIIQERPLRKPDPVRQMLKPFGKPSGKHRPKANDDTMAAQIERDQ